MVEAMRVAAPDNSIEDAAAPAVPF